MATLNRIGKRCSHGRGRLVALESLAALAALDNAELRDQDLEAVCAGKGGRGRGGAGGAGGWGWGFGPGRGAGGGWGWGWGFGPRS